MDAHAQDVTVVDADAEVVARAERARRAWRQLATAPGELVDRALSRMADRLVEAADELIAANGQDNDVAARNGSSAALRDRLRLDRARLDGIAAQLRRLATTPFPERDTDLGPLPGGLRLVERRCPVGVVGANFEARPNVTIDMASQLVKSRNAGVLRTGSAALGSAIALHERVIAPGLSDAGLDPDVVQLIRHPGREVAVSLVRQPDLIRLVVLRGSGDTTRSLGAEAASHGVRTLAHADGGGVLYVDATADLDLARRLLVGGIDRLGVCNRVNLVLVARSISERVIPEFVAALRDNGIQASLPPHPHPLGHEWALDAGNEATVTIAEVADAEEALTIAIRDTSGLGATIVAESARIAQSFIDAYTGTGVFWNASTRLLDGATMHGVPETGINVDHLPGPRGPVTFRDLYLRQYVVVPDGQVPLP